MEKIISDIFKYSVRKTLQNSMTLNVSKNSFQFFDMVNNVCIITNYSQVSCTFVLKLKYYIFSSENSLNYILL